MRVKTKKDLQELESKLASARKNADLRKQQQMTSRKPPKWKGIIASLINFLLY